MALRKIQHGLFLLFVLLAAVAGFEYRSNRRGPWPLPTEASLTAGRELLGKVLGTYEAASWTDRDTVDLRADVSALGRSERRLRMTLDGRSRSADFRDLSAPAIVYHLDGRTEVLTPAFGPLGHELRKLAPSLVWWAMAPRDFDDSDALVWRLPDRKQDGRLANRFAVRWPGEIDWYVFSVDPADARIVSIEFIDDRLSPVLRWRAVAGGRSVAGGAVVSSSWRFSAANPVLRFLTGGRDLIVLKYGPVV